MLVLAAIVVGDVEFAQIVDHAVARHAVEIGERDVVLDVVDQVEAVGLAILGDVGDAVLDRLADRGDVDRLALEQHLAGDAAAIGAAEQAHGEFGAPGAHQPGDADHLALADVDVDALDHLPLGVDRVIDRPVLHLEARPRRSSARAADSDRRASGRPSR